MKLRNLFIYHFILGFLVSCGSSPKKVVSEKAKDVKTIYKTQTNEIEIDNSSSEIQREYIVTDRYPEKVPGWVREELRVWLKSNAKDTQEYSYFVKIGNEFTDREIACKQTSSLVMKDIASKARSFISDSFTSFIEGDSRVNKNNPDKQHQIKSFENSLTKSGVEMMLSGVDPTYGSFWEERNYRKKLGTNKNYYTYVCSTLVKIKKQILTSYVDKWLKGMVDKHFANDEQRKIVREGLKDVAKKFADQE